MMSSPGCDSSPDFLESTPPVQNTQGARMRARKTEEKRRFAAKDLTNTYRSPPKTSELVAKAEQQDSDKKPLTSEALWRTPRDMRVPDSDPEDEDSEDEDDTPIRRRNPASVPVRNVAEEFAVAEEDSPVVTARKKPGGGGGARRRFLDSSDEEDEEETLPRRIPLQEEEHEDEDIIEVDSEEEETESGDSEEEDSDEEESEYDPSPEAVKPRGKKPSAIVSDDSEDDVQEVTPPSSSTDSSSTQDNNDFVFKGNAPTGTKAKKDSPKGVPTVILDKSPEQKVVAPVGLSPEDVRHLEDELARKQRALKSNLRMLSNPERLPDGGVKLRAFVDRLVSEQDDIEKKLKRAKESGASSNTSASSASPPSSSNSSSNSSSSSELSPLERKLEMLKRKRNTLRQQYSLVRPSQLTDGGAQLRREIGQVDMEIVRLERDLATARQMSGPGSGERKAILLDNWVKSEFRILVVYEQKIFFKFVFRACSQRRVAEVPRLHRRGDRRRLRRPVPVGRRRPLSAAPPLRRPHEQPASPRGSHRHPGRPEERPRVSEDDAGGGRRGGGPAGAEILSQAVPAPAASAGMAHVEGDAEPARGDPGGRHGAGKDAHHDIAHLKTQGEKI